MDIIDEEKFKKARELAPPLRLVGDKGKKISEEEFKKMMDELKNPIIAQKEIAVKVKFFLDARIEEEMTEKGYLSENTRRWLDSYNTMLEKLQKAIHGDKSINVNLTKISHQDIASKIREVD